MRIWLYKYFIDFVFSSGEVCFVYVPDDGGYWCRAECKDVQDDKNYSMYLIDYMKEITCDVKRIRKLTKEFSYPSVSARCLVNGNFL